MKHESRQIVTPESHSGISRREVLGLGAAAVLGTGIATVLPRLSRHEGGLRAEVFVGRAEHYQADLAALIANGLGTIGLSRDQVRGKRVLLKPNLVETALGQSHINTHPSVILAAAEAFRRFDAASIIVAEGQGHRRDSWLVLDESGMGTALEEAGLEFVDLNHDDVARVPNVGGWSHLENLFLPKTLLGADLIVSVPKLKTHHWAGVTCAMKNFFGVMPGVVYGWPKNVLHYAGIENSILDINATVKPHLAIVDGIMGMEGDGPIMGTPKQLGCIVMGRNLPAVDATCVRLMGLQPFGVKYLTEASGRLGPIHEQNIAQRGETIAGLRTRFQLFDVPHLRSVAG